MTLRWRWALTLGVATAAIALLVLLASALLTARELRAQVDADLEQRLVLTTQGEFPRPVPAFEGRSRRLAPVNLDALYRLLDPSGAVIFDTSDGDLPLTAAALDLAARTTPDHLLRTVTIEDARYRMIVGGLTDRRGEANLGAVQIAVSIDAIESSISALGGRSAGIAALLILAAAAVGWYLAGRTIGPLTELSEEAERIAKTEDLTATVTTTRTDEIGRLAMSFSAMITALRSSREQQQRLVADAGHEFRTPLTALRTNLETLQRRRSQLTDEQVTELIDAALDESIELTTLATELVELSADAASTGEEARWIEMEAIAETVANRFSSRTADPISIEGAGDAVEVRVSQLERAVANLVSNAVTWNEAGQPVTIHLDSTTLTVRDHGPGIPDADLPLVFERFHRSDTARTKPGSGLGLSIVRHVVEGHGGEVFARNAVGGGAEVGFTLPAKIDPEQRKTGGP